MKCETAHHKIRAGLKTDDYLHQLLSSSSLDALVDPKNKQQEKLFYVPVAISY